MRDVGLVGKVLKNRNWDDLVSLGSAYPVMAERKTGHWVIVASAISSPDGRTMLAVLDPLTEQTGVSLTRRDQRPWQ